MLILQSYSLVQSRLHLLQNNIVRLENGSNLVQSVLVFCIEFLCIIRRHLFMIIYIT